MNAWKKTICIFGLAGDPPGEHHRAIAQALAATRKFDLIKVIPCGPRPDKNLVATPLQRAVMADFTFRGVAQNVEVDSSDLERDEFTRTRELQRLYEAEWEVWHVVGADLARGGKSGNASIQKKWQHGLELWRELRFVVTVGPGNALDLDDLPPHRLIAPIEKSGSSTEIRRRCMEGESITGLVTPEVEAYIERHHLYQGQQSSARTTLQLSDPRLLVVADERNPKALSVREDLKEFEDVENPNLIVSLGGDGTMFRTVHREWRRRLPFLGLNMGHLGFLINRVAEEGISYEFFRQGFEVLCSPLLRVEVTKGDDSQEVALAVNDAWMQVEPGKTGLFELMVTNKDGVAHMRRIVGDGLLVATAAGSSAYAYAMGAERVPIGTEVLVVVGSNIFSPPQWRRGVNVPLDSIVEIRNTDDSGWRKTLGFADNISFGEVKAMRIGVSRIAAAELVFLTGHEERRRVLLNQFPKT